MASALQQNEIEHKPYVNILTWWGYLNLTPEQIKEAEKKCNVRISYDTYYSNRQFLNRFDNSKFSYDLIIFSQTILNTIQKKINLPQSKLYMASNEYLPTIKQHYMKEKLPHNVVYFLHSLTGFLYNKNLISINTKDSVKQIFAKAGNNIVVMIDDPVEANFLISLLLHNSQTLSMKKANQFTLSWDNFKKIIQSSNVIITNVLDHIIKLPNFAFAYQWSGDAVLEMQKQHNSKMKFLVHPKLSYVSTDLLAELNLNQSTQCVANTLSSQKYLDVLQKKTFYFSPYGIHSDIKNPFFKAIYKQFLQKLPNLPWIISVSMANFKKIERAWQIVKYRLQTQHETK